MLLFKYKLYTKNDIFTLFREAFRQTGDKLIEICIFYEEEVFPCGGGHCKGEGYAFVEEGAHGKPLYLPLHCFVNQNCSKKIQSIFFFKYREVER